ncbi:MAG TPA: hypothetical protein VGR62_13580 [Candidatus Binatia bacterium]|jgi:hypothetical protein|nr:hypothetical protein [Candidatus Binatia bacterium]
MASTAPAGRTIAAALALYLASVTAASASGCPSTVDESTFASETELRELASKMAGFGLRSTASRSNEQFIDWLKQQMRRIDGMKIRTERIKLRRWQPLPESDDVPGRDLAKAGELRLVQSDGSTQPIPVAGAVPYALPTSKNGSRGPLVYLAPDQPITAQNAAGKVVLREFPDRAIPYIGFQILGIYLTPDLAARTGNYERPYLAALHDEMLAAGIAGAAGIVFAFHVPTEQVRGYFDPHNGTHYTVPAVFVGGDEAEQLKAAAGGNVSASIVVRAEVGRAKTRNLIATLPGQSPERIVFSVNTDGNTWVQDDGNAGILALARYLADLPIECRPRTFEFMFGAAHLHISREGTDRYASQLDQDYDDGTVAFAFVLEHLGTREILPVPDADGSGQHLEFTGAGDPLLWAAGDSEALRQAAITATQQRHLDYTAVLKGAELPVAGRVPEICSFGGIGGAFQSYLIPTMAMISGPWSLWAPSFGESAIDFTRMRSQLLAAGDAVLGLAQLPSAQIAGDYPRLRAQRAAGAPTCSHELPPEQAPGPGG